MNDFCVEFGVEKSFICDIDQKIKYDIFISNEIDEGPANSRYTTSGLLTQWNYEKFTLMAYAMWIGCIMFLFSSMNVEMSKLNNSKMNSMIHSIIISINKLNQLISGIEINLFTFERFSWSTRPYKYENLQFVLGSPMKRAPSGKPLKRI